MRTLNIAISQSPCCSLTISGEDVDALLEEYPSIALKVLHSLADKLDEARETIRQLALVPSESRIALTLLRLAERVGEPAADGILIQDRKSTRLNSSHVAISYAVFCLKKKHTNR